MSRIWEGCSPDDHWLGLVLPLVLSRFLPGWGMTLNTHAVLGAKYQHAKPSPTLSGFTFPRRSVGAAQGQGGQPLRTCSCALFLCTGPMRTWQMMVAS